MSLLFSLSENKACFSLLLTPQDAEVCLQKTPLTESSRNKVEVYCFSGFETADKLEFFNFFWLFTTDANTLNNSFKGLLQKKIFLEFEI